MKEYKWFGNIRELKNLIESLFVIKHGQLIEAEDIKKHLKSFDNGYSEPYVSRNLPVHTHKTSEQVERELIYRALLEIKNDVDDIKGFIDNYQKNDGFESRTVLPAPYIETQNSATDEDLTLDEMEKRYIIKMLKKFHGNKRLAAKKLNISERTLYRKINEFGLNGKIL